MDSSAGEISDLDRNVASGCDHCGEPLHGRQSRFCSRECNNAEWRARNPTLPERDKLPKGPLIPRIAQLWREAPGWRTDREAAAALGVLEGSFAARRRESSWKRHIHDGLCFEGDCERPERYEALGWVWETRRRLGSKEREHRLISTGQP